MKMDCSLLYEKTVTISNPGLVVDIVEEDSPHTRRFSVLDFRFQYRQLLRIQQMACNRNNRFLTNRMGIRLDSWHGMDSHLDMQWHHSNISLYIHRHIVTNRRYSSHGHIRSWRRSNSYNILRFQWPSPQCIWMG